MKDFKTDDYRNVDHTRGNAHVSIWRMHLDQLTQTAFLPAIIEAVIYFVVADVLVFALCYFVKISFAGAFIIAIGINIVLGLCLFVMSVWRRNVRMDRQFHEGYNEQDRSRWK